jgi:hypothetical protein
MSNILNLTKNSHRILFTVGRNKIKVTFYYTFQHTPLTINVELLSSCVPYGILYFAQLQKHIQILIEDDQFNSSVASTTMASTASTAHTISPSAVTYSE